MLTTKKNTTKADPPISSVRLSLRRAGGCFGGVCQLPPLTTILFDEMFRTDELRAGAANLPNPVNAPVAVFKNPTTGETK